MDYLSKLNREQKEAAMYTEGPLLILAGAGSGKTSTMTHRIAYMIDEKGVDPYNILAVTFTNKAAREMRDRVEALVGHGLPSWILTFHSACLRILRAHAEVLGYGRDFTVYDPTDQKTLVKNIIKELGIDGKRFTPSYFLGIISKCKEQRITWQEYPRVYGDDIKAEMAGKVYAAYEETLKKNNAMDFDDLLLNAVRLFEQDEAVLLEYQNRFRYIMVDEYQDTNRIQYLFIKMLAEAHNNICVVGDDDQCIYQWRGADIRNILEFEKDFKGVKTIKLEQNYRSTSTILDAAHSVISNNRGRKAKKLWTDKEPGNKIIYYRADDERDEAYFVAGEINRMKSSDRKYSDFAILYRTNSQSRTFEEVLSRRDIPYRVLGGLRYYDRKEIKDIMCYLRLIQNKSDDLALARIINEPKRGIGGKTLDKLRSLASVRGESLFDTLTDREVTSSFSSKVSANIESFVDMVESYSAEKDNMKISDLYDGVLVKSGYLRALEEQSAAGQAMLEAESRMENLMEFKSVIYDYEEEDPNISLSEFMERIALLAEVDNHDAGENAVVMMTMHSAKGLEFPFVFMPGMEDGLFPGWRAFDRPEGLEEERRLCYVGITRAKERLWLTSAQQRTIYGKTDYTRESQFLRELDKKLLEGDAIYEKKKTDAGRGAFTDGITKSKSLKPFDQLKYARQQTKKNVEALSSDLAPGDAVSHPKFGEGQVISCDGKIVAVKFGDETKKLALGFAPLKKL